MAVARRDEETSRHSAVHVFGAVVVRLIVYLHSRGLVGEAPWTASPFSFFFIFFHEFSRKGDIAEPKNYWLLRATSLGLEK